MGLSLGLNLSLSLQLSQQLSHATGVKFELGEDLDSMIKRELLIDWVVPHEIGHLVDRELKNPSKATADGFDLESYTDGWIEDDDFHGIFRSNVDHNLKEIFIDGIGLALGKSHGTSFPSVSSESERLKILANSFVGAINVIFEYIPEDLDVESNPEEAIQKGVVLLRMIAVARTFQDKLEEIAPGLSGEISRTEGKLDDRFTSLGLKDIGIGFSQKNTLIEMFRKAFKVGSELELPRAE